MCWSTLRRWKKGEEGVRREESKDWELVEWWSERAREGVERGRELCNWRSGKRSFGTGVVWES